MVVQKSRIPDKNQVIDIAGLSRCVIPVQNYIPPVTAGVLLVTDETKRRRLGHPATSIRSASFTSGMISRKPAKPSRCHRRPAGIAPKNRSILPRPRRRRCRRPCKIFGLNRTKMFHVKHFGTIQTAENEPRLVGFHAPAVSLSPRNLLFPPAFAPKP
jgi:hypothetical protein